MGGYVKRCVVVIVIVFYACVAFAQEVNMEFFNDSKHGFSIAYPQGWQQEKIGGNYVCKVTTDRGANRKAIIITLDPSDAAGQPLDLYYDYLVKEIRMAGIIPGMKVLSIDKGYVNGYPAVRMKWIQLFPTHTAVEEQRFIRRKTDLFVLITRAAGETRDKALETYSNYEPLFNEIEKTFIIENPEK